MYSGREGRSYVTRTQPDNRGLVIGEVIGAERGEMLVDTDIPIEVGDGLAFEAPDAVGGPTVGFAVTAVRRIADRPRHRQALRTRTRVPNGWRVVRTSQANLLARSRASYASIADGGPPKKIRLDIRVFGSVGAHLKVLFRAAGDEVEARSETQLVPAANRALHRATLREQLGRLGETPFALAEIDDRGLDNDLFLPIRELNRVRQSAIEQLMRRRDWASEAREAAHIERIEKAISAIDVDSARPGEGERPFTLSAQVYNVDDAERAADAGATEVTFDPFLRHPAPSLARVRALAESLGARGIDLRLRTPTIVRPEERRSIAKWLDLGLPLLSGHLGLVADLARAGRDVVADYAVNVMNQHTAAQIFRLGARRAVLSVELTADEIRDVTAPWHGAGFDLFLYGRPEGMTIEHCVLSAAFDREPTTCRDLCVQKHANITLTDPAGYHFGVATDTACRNRLLHSRPIEGSEHLPRLWRAGIRGYQVVFNVEAEPIADVVAGYRQMLDRLAAGQELPANETGELRAVLHGEFTRGHFARAV